MNSFLDIDHQIFLNQVAQGHRSIEELSAWFKGLPRDEKLLVLKTLGEMVHQAKPQTDDGIAAVQASGLKPTFTPCVLLTKGTTRVQLTKLVSLPESEGSRVLVLLVHLFRVSDNRRRSQEADLVERHWWHRDLSDPQIVEEVRALYRAGKL